MYEIKESRVRNTIVTTIMLCVAGYLAYETYRLSTREYELLVPVEVRNFDMLLPPITYGDNFFGVSFPDRDNGWIVGTYGTVIHTSDGGRNWARQDSTVRGPLFSVFFVSLEQGWAVGKSGVIVHTADGGKTWQVQESGTKHLLSGLHFVDPLRGWVVGEWGTILHTADGGQEWVVQQTGEDVILNDVFMVDGANGWVVGERGTILSTSDGGANWTPKGDNIGIEITERVRGEPLTIKDLSLFAAHFTSSTEGWIAGIDGVMFHTADAGQTWDVLPQVVKRSLFDVVVRDGRAWAVGSEGTFITSGDGGKQWHAPSPSPVPTTYWIYRAAFVSPQRGYVVGAHGSVFRTDDGGASWTRLGEPSGSAGQA